MLMFLRCVGEAVVAQGLKGLLGLVPYGDQVYEVARDAIDRYAKARKEQQLAADAEAVLQANLGQIRREARQIAREVAAGQPEATVLLLESYLTQLPSVARQLLKRPADPSGTTIPAALDLRDPIQFASLLPRQPPRFRADDPVPHAEQWRFVELLGSGGFGEVWLARNAYSDQVRAIKFCLERAARERLLRHELEVVKRVMKESKTLQSDQHGIVPLLDAYLDGDAPWLAYEYIDGGDLAGRVRELASLDPAQRGQQALQILRCLAQVVSRFHRLPDPVIHRDLKPANILVQRSGDKRLLRVTDFGISHIAADQALRSASVATPSVSLGATFRGAHTPIYASPQQKRGLKADVRDDVHALGILGYQMLLGDLGAERPAGKWRKRVAACQIPDALLDILESCWDDDPDERPRDATALLEALRVDPPKKQDPPSPPPKKQDPHPLPPPAATATKQDSPLDAATLHLKPQPEVVRVDPPPPAADRRNAVSPAVRIALFTDCPESAPYAARGYGEGPPGSPAFPGPPAPEAVRKPQPLRGSVPTPSKPDHVLRKGTVPVTRRKALLIGLGITATLGTTGYGLYTWLADPPVTKDTPLPRTGKVGDVWTNGAGMKFSWVPPGTSWLGGGGGNAGSQTFTLANGLWCGTYEVTQAEWVKITKAKNPSHFANIPRYPVESVSWDNVQKFLEALNTKWATTGHTYRLPTEQEWEYICRGGPLSSQEQSAYDFYFAKAKDNLTPAPTNLSRNQANWFNKFNERRERVVPSQPSEVGLHLPNPLGIYNLHGNVWEWTSSLRDGGPARVIRGGCWDPDGEDCRASSRHGSQPGRSMYSVGFRVLVAPASVEPSPAKSGA